MQGHPKVSMLGVTDCSLFHVFTLLPWVALLLDHPSSIGKIRENIKGASEVMGKVRAKRGHWESPSPTKTQLDQNTWQTESGPECLNEKHFHGIGD